CQQPFLIKLCNSTILRYLVNSNENIKSATLSDKTSGEFVAIIPFSESIFKLRLSYPAEKLLITFKFKASFNSSSVISIPAPNNASVVFNSFINSLFSKGLDTSGKYEISKYFFKNSSLFFGKLLYTITFLIISPPLLFRSINILRHF